MFFAVYSKLCVEEGKSPNGVAKLLGFPSSSVTQWKKGSTPRPAALQKIAEYFNVSVAFLLGSEQKEKPIANSDEQLDAELIMRLCQLTPDEIQKVDAFVQGLLASR